MAMEVYMEEKLYNAGDVIRAEEGKREFLLLDEARYNKKFYLVKAKELGTDHICLLKFVLEGDETYKINNLQREGFFRFYYPYIEHIYGYFDGEGPDGSTLHGVAGEFIEGEELLVYRRKLQKEIEDGQIGEEEAEGLIRRQILQFLYGMNYYLRFAKAIYLHRDLRPENVMITKEGNVKIVDFDYAHISGSDKTRRMTGWDLGFSTGYASPEIFRSDAVKKYPDMITEIYSAGRLLFFWLNGKHYYDKEQTEAPKRAEIQNSTKQKQVREPMARYCEEEELRFGIEANTNRFLPKYLKSDCARLRRILAKMCCDPEKETPYRSVKEIIEELEALWGPLEGTLDGKPQSAVPVACKINDGLKSGRLLYENTMRDIRIGGRVVLTIYNRQGRIYYIPMPGVELLGGNEEYLLSDHSILNCNGNEIIFSIDTTRGEER